MKEGSTECQGSREKPEIYQIGGKGGNRFTEEVELETIPPAMHRHLGKCLWAKTGLAFDFERAFNYFLPYLRYIDLEQLAGVKSCSRYWRYKETSDWVCEHRVYSPVSYNNYTYNVT